MFEMSVLWYIHRWRRLLEKTYTETKDIWRQSRKQLIYIGREFNRDIEIESIFFLKVKLINEIKTDRSLIYLFSLSLSWNFDCMNLILHI